MSPVLHRELILGARDRVFAHLRWIAAGIALGILTILARWIEAPPGQIGGVVFRWFHLVWCPLLLAAGVHQTAPTLVQERAQGTLGLLFLTSMHPFEVVTAKAAAAFLRVLALWLAGLPMSAVPVVLGAVSLGDIFVFASLNLAWAVTGIGVGLILSAAARDPSRGIAGASAMGVPAAVLLLVGWHMTAGMLGAWPRVQAVVGTLYGLGVAVVVAIVSAGIASAVVQRRWREDEAPPEPPKRADDWTAEDIEEATWVERWRNGPGRELRSRRPLAWLRRRKPGQVETYGLWCLWVLICWLAAIATGRVLPVWVCGLVQMGAMAVQASSGYRPEVLSGAMELLLTTPMPDRAYFQNRISSLVRVHGLSLVLHLLASAWAACVSTSRDVFPAWATVWPVMGLVLAPFAGLVAAGRWRGAIPSALATIALVLAVPAASIAARLLGVSLSVSAVLMWGGLATAVGSVAWAAVRGHRSREFVLRLMKS